ncbi:synaptonemal complex protein 2-like [Lytechinus pictus]|uniref:synaptonemal complex protein 2-like n=1 Tax=Lytechinus pictus TaxID=7653 RepID=UPI0030B9DE90
MPVSTTSFKAGKALEAAVLCGQHGLSYFKHIERTLQDVKNSQDQPHEQACSVEMMRKLITTIQEQLPCQRFWQAEIMVLVIKHIAVSTQEGKSENLSVFLDNGLSEILVFVYEETKRYISQAGRDVHHEADNLMEVLFETINEVSEYSGAARKLMVEAFCARLIMLVIDTKILFHTRMEAERTLNLMLEGCEDDDLTWIGNDPVTAKLMQRLADLLPVAGDFEMQIAITESLARMVTKSERRRRSPAWFPVQAISEAFLAIDDQRFDSDCRIFLNLLNESCRERSVCSFPCKKAFLGDFELRNPNEDKVSEFWVDFNAVSQSITMYVADEDTGLEEDGGLWETVTFSKEKVQEYLVNEDEKGFINLVVTLKEPASSILAFCGNDSRTATIIFNQRTDLADALDLSLGLDKNAAPIETPSSSRRSSVSKINVLVNRARNTSWGLSNMPQSFNDGYIDAGAHHELHSGKHVGTSGDMHADEAKATPVRRKISIPLVPMITPTRTSLHSAASSSVSSSGGVACQGKQTNQGFVQPKTPAGIHGSTKKVKTPLQVIVADKPSSSGTDIDHPRPQSRTPAKVSVTRNTIVCQSPRVVQEETEQKTTRLVANRLESASSDCDGVEQEVAVQQKTRKGKRDQVETSSANKSAKQTAVNDAGKENVKKGQSKKGKSDQVLAVQSSPNKLSQDVTEIPDTQSQSLISQESEGSQGTRKTTGRKRGTKAATNPVSKGSKRTTRSSRVSQAKDGDTASDMPQPLQTGSKSRRGKKFTLYSETSFVMDSPEREEKNTGGKTRGKGKKAPKGSDEKSAVREMEDSEGAAPKGKAGRTKMGKKQEEQKDLRDTGRSSRKSEKEANGTQTKGKCASKKIINDISEPLMIHVEDNLSQDFVVPKTTVKGKQIRGVSDLKVDGMTVRNLMYDPDPQEEQERQTSGLPQIDRKAAAQALAAESAEFCVPSSAPEERHVSSQIIPNSQPERDFFRRSGRFPSPLLSDITEESTLSKGSSGPKLGKQVPQASSQSDKASELIVIKSKTKPETAKADSTSTSCNGKDPYDFVDSSSVGSFPVGSRKTPAKGGGGDGTSAKAQKDDEKTAAAERKKRGRPVALCQEDGTEESSQDEFVENSHKFGLRNKGSAKSKDQGKNQRSTKGRKTSPTSDHQQETTETEDDAHEKPRQSSRRKMKGKLDSEDAYIQRIQKETKELAEFASRMQDQEEEYPDIEVARDVALVTEAYDDSDIHTFVKSVMKSLPERRMNKDVLKKDVLKKPIQGKGKTLDKQDKTFDDELDKEPLCAEKKVPEVDDAECGHRKKSSSGSRKRNSKSISRSLDAELEGEVTSEPHKKPFHKDISRKAVEAAAEKSTKSTRRSVRESVTGDESLTEGEMSVDDMVSAHMESILGDRSGSIKKSTSKKAENRIKERRVVSHVEELEVDNEVLRHAEDSISRQSKMIVALRRSSGNMQQDEENNIDAKKVQRKRSGDEMPHTSNDKSKRAKRSSVSSIQGDQALHDQVPSPKHHKERKSKYEKPRLEQSDDDSMYDYERDLEELEASRKKMKQDKSKQQDRITNKSKKYTPKTTNDKTPPYSSKNKRSIEDNVEVDEVHTRMAKAKPVTTIAKMERSALTSKVSKDRRTHFGSQIEDSDSEEIMETATTTPPDDTSTVVSVESFSSMCKDLLKSSRRGIAAGRTRRKVQKVDYTELENSSVGSDDHSDLQTPCRSAKKTCEKSTSDIYEFREETSSCCTTSFIEDAVSECSWLADRPKQKVSTYSKTRREVFGLAKISKNLDTVKKPGNKPQDKNANAPKKRKSKNLTDAAEDEFPLYYYEEEETKKTKKSTKKGTRQRKEPDDTIQEPSHQKILSKKPKSSCRRSLVDCMSSLGSSSMSHMYDSSQDLRDDSDEGEENDERGEEEKEEVEEEEVLITPATPALTIETVTSQLSCWNTPGSSTRTPRTPKQVSFVDELESVGSDGEGDFEMDCPVSGPSKSVRASESTLKKKYANLLLDDEDENIDEDIDEDVSLEDDAHPEVEDVPRSKDKNMGRLNQSSKHISMLEPRILYQANNPMDEGEQSEHSGEDGISDHSISSSWGHNMDFHSMQMPEMFGFMRNRIKQKLTEKRTQTQKFTETAIQSTQRQMNKLFLELHKARQRGQNDFQHKLLTELVGMEGSLEKLGKIQAQNEHLLKQYAKKSTQHVERHLSRVEELHAGFLRKDATLGENVVESLQQVINKDMKAMLKRMLQDMQQEQMKKTVQSLFLMR